MSPSGLTCTLQLIAFIALSTTARSQQLILLLSDPVRHDLRSPAIIQTLMQIAVCPSGEQIAGSFQSSIPHSPAEAVSFISAQDIVTVQAPATAFFIYLNRRDTTMVGYTLTFSVRCGSSPLANWTVIFDSVTSPYLLEAPPVDPIPINHTVSVGESVFQLKLDRANSSSSQFNVSLQRT